MKLPYTALSFFNSVGEYQIIDDYIQVKQHHVVKKKLIENTVTHKRSYLDAVNLQLKKPKNIILFCNQYGLLNSSAANTYASLALHSFYSNITTIKSLYHTRENLHDKTNGSTPHLLLQNLLTLISSRYDLPQVLDLRNSASLEKFIFPCKENTPNSFHYLEDLSKFNNSLVSVDRKLPVTLHTLVSKLTEENLPFSIDDYGAFSISDEFRFSYETREILYDIAPKILTCRINEFFKNIPPEFHVDKEGKLHINWKINSLFEYLVLELTFDFSEEHCYTKCQNVNCGKIFIPIRAATAQYCSKQCINAVAKRNQRKRAREKEEQKNTGSDSSTNE